MKAHAGPAGTTLVEILRNRAASAPGRTAFEIIEDDGSEWPISYADLDLRARSVAAVLLSHCQPGARALIVCPPGADYVAAFLGCMYAGVTAVPVYPPTTRRGMDRAVAVAADAQAAVVLTTSSTAAAIRADHPDLDTASMCWLATDDIAAGAADGWAGPGPRPDQLALLQYTSGSTGAPKGVMVGHANLVSNSAAISGALGLGQDSRGVSWLPPYHDMGLIGGILQPIYAGFPCTLLSPLAFLRRPARWLEALSRHRASISAAPDFAYLECARRVSADERAQLDLTGWRHALVGAEPVRAGTLDEFAGAFAECGFRRSAFRPCYGLAEATLFVTGGGPRTAGPRLLSVVRSELARGRAVVAGPADPGPAAVLTSCGRSHGQDRFLVVDEKTHRPCPPAAIGEVWVSGPSVTRGYWHREAETEHSFGAALAGQPGPRFLRTGDLGFQHERELYITGRIKDLMVIRGRNHYPADVEETSERAHALLKPARAAAFSVDDGSEERVVLVHEVAGGFRAEDAPAVTQAIRAAVSAEHGLRVHDVTLVRPGGIPRTTSGKIMRSACRERWLSGSLTAAGSASEPSRDPQASPPGDPQASPPGDPQASPPGDPQASPPGDPLASPPGERAARLARITAAALGTRPGQVPADVPLIALGLDSLRAVQLTSSLADLLGLQVSVPSLLGGATLAGLRAELAASGRADPAGHRPGDSAVRAAPTAPVPAAAREPAGLASPAQEWLWLLDQMGAGGAYHIAASLSLRGPLDPALLHECLSELVRQHAVLRTTFAAAADGTLRLTVHPPADVELPRHDLTGAGDLAERQAGARHAIEQLAEQPFDLAVGPLLRTILIQLAPGDWRLGVAVHHIAVDGWSLGVLLRQLGTCYADRAAGGAMPVLTAPSRASVSRRAAAPDPDAAAAEAFWQDTLAGAQAAALPTARPPPRAPSWRGAWLPVEVPAANAGRLRAFGAARMATPFMVLLTGFAAALARWCGQDDLVIGTPAAGRNRPGSADTVGLLVSTMPVRVDLSGTPTFTGLLARVRDACLAAYSHQDLPLDRIISAAGLSRSAGRAPLVRVLLALQNIPADPWHAAGVRAEPTELPAPGAQFELSLHLSERPDGSLAGHASYAADLLDPATVQGLLDTMMLTLDHALRSPDLPVADLPVLGPPERDRIVAELSGASRPPLASGLVHTLVEAQADSHSALPAVVWAGAELSYRDLESRANRLARYLRACGVTADQPVAVCVHRSASLVVALLAVLKSGGTYLPLDPSYPQSRLALLMSDARPALVLTTRDLLDRGLLEGSAQRPRVIFLDEHDGALSDFPDSRPVPVTEPGNLAYIIHTSGSTGTPKGVMTTHAGFANRLAWMQSAFRLTPGEAVLHKTPVGFDVSGWELFWPLIAGATVVLARPDGHRDPLYLVRLIRQHAVTTCHFVPAMLRAFLADPAAARRATSLRRVVCSGEELPPDLARQFLDVLPGVELHNLYGPTEAAIDVTAQAVTEVPEVRVPIGRPIAGARLQVLDPRGHPVPCQVEGELHIGGIPLARGYLGRPGLTAERFVPDPFTPGERLYATGDRARWLADGSLDYLGRLDRQVKIRGHRIEPAEIEAALAAHPAITAVAVDLRGGPGGEPALVAYLVPAGTDTPSTAALRAFLAASLPASMIPAAFAWIPRLPAGPNGKLDRSLLPDPAISSGTGTHTPAADPLERWLGGLWCEALGLAEVSVTDDFFDLGGHSLLATKVVARIRAAYGVEIPVGDLLSGALTIESLARSLRQEQAAAASPQELSSAAEWLDGLTDEEVTRLLAQASHERAGDTT